MSLRDINGKEIYVDYEPVESGPVVFFIHGLGSSANYYDGVVKELGNKASFVRMDTEGAGRTPLSGVPSSIDTVAADVVGVLDSLGIEKATIVGHSMGGMIASRIGEKYGDRVDKLVLIGPVHPTDKIAAVFADRIAKIEETGSIQFLVDSVPNAAVGQNATDAHKQQIAALIASSSPAGYIANCRVIANAAKTVPNYAFVRAPALILVGADDKTAPYAGCVEVPATSLGGGAEVVTLQGVGHWHAVEAPVAVASAIAKFIV